MIADVSLSAGWTWDYVEDTLTPTRLAALYRRWRRAPPSAPASLASSAGSSVDPSGIGGLIARFPDGRVPAAR